jgi:hypothetical protein
VRTAETNKPPFCLSLEGNLCAEEGLCLGSESSNNGFLTKTGAF